MKHGLVFVFAILMFASIANCTPADKTAADVAADAKSAVGGAVDKVVDGTSSAVKKIDPSKQSGSGTK